MHAGELAQIAKARLQDVLMSCRDLLEASDQELARDGVWEKLEQAEEKLQDALVAAGLLDETEKD